MSLCVLIATVISAIAHVQYIMIAPIALQESDLVTKIMVGIPGVQEITDENPKRKQKERTEDARLQ